MSGLGVSAVLGCTTREAAAADVCEAAGVEETMECEIVLERRAPGGPSP